MSGLWKFSVRVQSWSDKIESNPILICKIFENHQFDPVLICQCKIVYFYFASWGKISTRAILPFANCDWLKAKDFQHCLCLMRQNRHSLSAFPKFKKKMLCGIRGKSTAGVILPLGESNCLDWSSDKIHLDQLKVLVAWPKALNLKPKLEPKT